MTEVILVKRPAVVVIIYVWYSRKLRWTTLCIRAAEILRQVFFRACKTQSIFKNLGWHRCCFSVVTFQYLDINQVRCLKYIISQLIKDIENSDSPK